MVGFNVNDVYTAVLAVVGSAPVTGLLIKKFGKPVASKIEQAVKDDGPIIVNELKDVGHAVEDLLKIPELAPLKAALAEKEKAVKTSELGRIAAAALHAYEIGFNALTQNEKGTLITLVRAELAKVHLEFTDAEIVVALTDAQKLAEIFKGTEAFKNTLALEQSLKALIQIQPNT